MEVEKFKIIGNPVEGKNFRNMRVHTRYCSDDSVELALTNKITDFVELMNLRKQSQNVNELEKALHGEGYIFANIGTSALITLEYKSESYLLTTRVDKSPVSTAKLLSGYTPAELMKTPESHTMQEMAEEFLPMSKGKVIPGSLEEVLKLKTPHSNCFVEDESRALEYSDDLHYSISPGNNFDLPGMKSGKISLIDSKGKCLHLSNAKFHSAADTNSGQLIFKYSLELPDCPDISLHHSEEKLRQGTSFLDTYFHEEGMLLFKLD